MVLTSFPTDQRRGKVKVKILAHTVCRLHGQELRAHVEAGQEVEVDYQEFLLLKENGKAELVKVAQAPRKPATLAELEKEVLSRGYSEEAAKEIAQARFDGVHGEGARYLQPQEPVTEQLGGDSPDGEVAIEESVFRAAVEKKTKAEIVALAKQEFGLELDEASKKDELVDAVVKAATKG